MGSRHHQFLSETLRAQGVPHSGRTLYKHLTGTYDLLSAWKNPEAVCLAGLFHSIYGTMIFRHRAFPIEKRNVIRDLIGEEAEFLAYAFCVTARPKEFISNIKKEEVLLIDHIERDLFIVSPMELDALLEIEAANLIEQGSGAISTMRALLESGVSGHARAAIQEYLKRFEGR